MASFTVKLPTDLINNLTALEQNIGDIEDKMLEAATEVLEPEVKKNLDRAITGKYETGKLRASVDRKIRYYSSKGTRVGYVYFKGSVARKLKNGKTQKVRNGLKAAVLEYGKKDQPPRPFLRPAMNAKRLEIIGAMENTFDDEAKKYT